MENVSNDYLGKHKKFRADSKKLAMFFIISAFIVAIVVFWWLKLVGITVTGEAFCGLDEHTHGEECYNSELVCGYDETDTTDETGDSEAVTEDVHVHTDGCYSKSLICKKAEHTHSAECFPDKTADVESVSDWLSTFKNVKITNNIPENLIAVATTQVGYKESESNFEFDSEGNKNGYTRYGEWYGNPYGKWNATFVSFCLHYSNINNCDELKASGAESLRLAWSGRGVYSPKGEYEAQRGDVLFTDADGDGTADTVGIILSTDSKGFLVITGDSNDKVETVSVENSDAVIGFGRTGELHFAKDTEYKTETEEPTTATTEIEKKPVAPLKLFSSSAPSAAADAKIEYTTDLTRLLASAEIKTLEGVPVVDGSTVYIGQHYVVSLRFVEDNSGDEWLQFGHNEQHYLTYQLPSNIHCDPFTQWHPITATLEDGTVMDVGRYFIDENGFLRITFDDDENGVCFGHRYTNADVTIDFTATVGSTQSGDSAKVEFNDQIHVDVDIDDKAEMKVTKTHGSYDGVNNTIDYQIRIEATKAVIKDLVVPDDIWERHHALKDTIVVTDLKGNVLDPQPTIGAGSPGATGGFTLTGFPDFAAGEGYIINYKSSINDDLLGQEEVGLWNGVYPYGSNASGEPVNGEAQDWVNVELNKIEKEGNQSVLTDANGNIVPVIEWEIEIKKSDENLQGTVLIDTLGHGLEYYTGQPIKIKRYDHNGDRLNDTTLSWDDVEIVDNSMSFALPDGHRFVIVYYTTYEELKDGEHKHYTNQAKVTINNREEVAGGEADVVGFIPRINKSASGNDGEYVYFNIEADIPAVIKDWGSFFLTDLAAFWSYNDNSEGYLYVENIPEDLVITAETDSGRVISFTPYVAGGPTENTYIIISPAEGNQHHSFNVLFNTSEKTYDSSKWILNEDATLTVSYKIPFDAKTGVEWTGELQGDKTLEDVLLDGYKLANEAYLNYTDIIRATASTTYEYKPTITKKSVVNDDGTIDYTVVFYNTVPGSHGDEGYLSSATSINFTDTFDEKLEYVEGSLTVTCYDPWRTNLWLNKYQYNGSADGNSLDVSGTELVFKEYNYAGAQYNPDGSELWGTWLAYRENYLEYCNAMRGGEHVFTYKLKLKDEYLNGTDENRFELDNTAELFWDGDKSSGPASDTVEIKTGLLDKQAVQENNKLKFDIHINRQALDILEGSDTLTIEDTMTENLSVYWDSIKLYYEDDNGNWVDFDDTADNYTYTVTYDQTSNKLTFVVPDEVHIRIDYNTLVTQSGKVSVNNMVKVDGKAEVTDIYDANFTVQEHSGGATGSMHNFTLIKQDGDTDERLGNVTFHLYGPMPNPDAVLPEGVAKNITTDSGKALGYIGTYTTGADGTKVIESQYLTQGGPYALIEKDPPEGYIKLTKPVYFYFYNDDPNGIIQTVTTLIVVENYTYGFVLPETGGMGILPTAIIGISLTAFPVLYSIIRRKRERRFS